MESTEVDTTEDELIIELGATRVFTPTPGVQPSHQTEVACRAVGRRHRKQLPLFITLAAWQAARAHSDGDTTREVGGILWGMPRQEGRELFIDVLEAQPATLAQGDLGQLTFSHDTWQEVLREQSDNRRVVGWYHSHPGFGVFLSQQDTFIHQHFFTQSWQVALVLDPVQGMWGVYGWIDGQVTTWTGFELYAPRAQGQQLREQATQAQRARA